MADAVVPAVEPRAAIESVLDALANDPALAAVAVLGVLALLVALGLLVRILRRTPGDKLRRVLAERDEIAVLMHPNPDPDAMASALGVAELAAAVDTEAALQYAGQIRRSENRAFQAVLDLDFDRIEASADIAADDVVLVDHNTARGFRGAEAVEPLAVVDHHPGGGVGDAFTDVRTEYGSCASILAEYFEDLGFEPMGPEEFDADDEVDEEHHPEIVPPDIATALMYGIQTDTSNLTRGCSPGEFSAAEYLYDGVDTDALDRISDPQVEAEVLDVKARAIAEREVRNAFAVADVGTVSNVDAIPEAAVELLRLEGVTAVVVVGDREGTLHVSGRSQDDRIHMGKTLEEVVEEIPAADAGGHARMGGSQISIEHMEGLGPGGGLARSEFRERLFDAMAGDL